MAHEVPVNALDVAFFSLGKVRSDKYRENAKKGFQVVFGETFPNMNEETFEIMYRNFRSFQENYNIPKTVENVKAAKIVDLFHILSRELDAENAEDAEDPEDVERVGQANIKNLAQVLREFIKNSST